MNREGSTSGVHLAPISSKLQDYLSKTSRRNDGSSAAGREDLGVIHDLYDEGMQGLGALSADFFSDANLRAAKLAVATLRHKLTEVCERRDQLVRERDRAAETVHEIDMHWDDDDSPATRALRLVELLDRRVEHASADVLMCRGALERAIRDRDEIAEPYRSRALALAKFVMAAQAYFWAENQSEPHRDGERRPEMMYLPVELPRWVTSDDALEVADHLVLLEEPERLVG
ncbi:MAG TPA: hypothetical protein VKG43_09065 [Acidimicrobiales bacterium]|nr:hypothetical protein [Acidimicrobiales bacterium]